jgi:hypothetical protein
MHQAVEDGIQRVWAQQVLRPLEAALGTAVRRNDIFDSD